MPHYVVIITQNITSHTSLTLLLASTNSTQKPAYLISLRLERKIFLYFCILTTFEFSNTENFLASDETLIRTCVFSLAHHCLFRMKTRKKMFFPPFLRLCFFDLYRRIKYAQQYHHKPNGMPILYIFSLSNNNATSTCITWRLNASSTTNITKSDGQFDVNYRDIATGQSPKWQ